MQGPNRCYGCMEEKTREGKCSYCGWLEGNTAESFLYLPPGIVLQDKYLIGKVLGQGGFGITYLAWDLNLNIKLAVKEYLPQQLATRTTDHTEIRVYKQTLAESFSYGLEKFLEEARNLARFSEHPNIVTVKDFFKANGTAYLVMNYIEGMSLSEYLGKKNEFIAFDQAVDIFMAVLDALKEVHSEGVFHRDVSPDNILIDTKGRVHLIDFGTARQATGEINRSMSIIMKTGYSPEEQYRSKGRLGSWTDIYSVAASLYRSITGQMPPESIDRLVEDTLVPPSKLGVEIASHHEQALLKALAVRSDDRFQEVEDFQKALTGGIEKNEEDQAQPKDQDGQISDNESTSHVYSRESDQERIVSSPKRPGLISLVAVIFCIGLIWFGWMIIPENDHEESEIKKEGEIKEEDKILLDGDYIIDYEDGNIPLSNLELGDRVVDPTWEWEFRSGINYTGDGEIKPVVWIVVAIDHYNSILPSHVTLLSEESICRYAFDDSTDRGSDQGSNHWGNSGSTNAEHGLRAWLNSTGNHTGDGFYQAFSDKFKSAIINSFVSNKDSEGKSYNTYDYVFVPSKTELGDTEHERSYEIGTVYSYFENAADEDRVTRLEENSLWYWTRSPDTYMASLVRYVNSSGRFYDHHANDGQLCVRSVLNLKADTMVYSISD